ncbi:hypothetical protein KEM52_002664 [Ascosphaera acerosa]|nr:hypothetical protein KEM52_002664 [Ascosphaera acerosa]
MSERKVLTKYYPPDFDPSLISRKPKHLRHAAAAKLMTVRLMAPFSMQCTHCGEFIYKGRKFNARKETCEERYLNIPIYRFYIRCTRCSSEITFKTDPKHMDYAAERGAKRNFELWRDAKKEELEETEEQLLDRLEREEGLRQEQEERDKMAELEEKMLDSKREMAVADALDEIRVRNARIERGEHGGAERMALVRAQEEAELRRQREEDEIAEETRRAFTTEAGERVKRLADDDGAAAPGAVAGAASEPPPVFARTKKPAKKPLIAGLSIKKKHAAPASVATPAAAPAPAPGSAPALAATAPAAAQAPQRPLLLDYSDDDDDDGRADNMLSYDAHCFSTSQVHDGIVRLITSHV